jgi:hypothetical protein
VNMTPQSTIPTETVKGSVFKQLYHGRPHLVFVQEAKPNGAPRAIFEVKTNGPGGFKPIRPRTQFDGDPSYDSVEIVALYLQEVYGRFA